MIPSPLSLPTFADTHIHNCIFPVYCSRDRGTFSYFYILHINHTFLNLEVNSNPMKFKWLYYGEYARSNGEVMEFSTLKIWTKLCQCHTW